MSEVIYGKLKQAIVAGNGKEALQVSKEAVQSGIPVKDILSIGLIPGIREVGELFNKGEYFLPELIMGGKAMQEALEYLNPLLESADKATSISPGRFLIGTVKGDLHDIGKLIVAMMLKSNRWEVTDMGIDIPPEQFCSAVREGNFDIVGMSVLLTMTMPSVTETIQVFEKAGLRKKVKIMVGGAPVTQKAADEMGADGYGENAWEAVTVAEKLLVEIRRERGQL